MTVTTPRAARARAASTGRTQLLLLVNPRATRADVDALAAAVRALRGAFTVTTAYTESRGHATQLAREAARDGFAIVAAAGGDGTFSETAQGLAGSETALACLPTGCTNVFARSIGGLRRALPAAERLAAQERAGVTSARAVDLGTVNGRHFLSMSGVGFSASMTAAADAIPDRKARFGQLHFAAAAAGELARRYLSDPPSMHVEAGGRTATGLTAVIQNSRTLTYFGPREIRACDAAALDSGAISLTLLQRARPRDVPPVVMRLITRRVADHRHVESFASVSGATIVSADRRPLPVEADGEYLGEFHRLEFGVAPGALRVVA